jgi:hypothetical protein
MRTRNILSDSFRAASGDDGKSMIELLDDVAARIPQADMYLMQSGDKTHWRIDIESPHFCLAVMHTEIPVLIQSFKKVWHAFLETVPCSGDRPVVQA